MMPFFDNCANDTLRADDATRNPQLGALACDSYHPHYHFQSSAQYQWLAYVLAKLGRNMEADEAYARARFQDHQIGGQGSGIGKPDYEKHPASDALFCANIGMAQSEAGKLHDAAMAAPDSAQRLTLLDRAIEIDASHSNSLFARGRVYAERGEWEKTLMDLREAVRQSHLLHDRYHREASAEHLARGQQFMRAGQAELAINEFTKSLDLYGRNSDALRARANAYHQKGSLSLAHADEAKLSALG